MVNALLYFIFIAFLQGVIVPKPTHLLCVFCLCILTSCQSTSIEKPLIIPSWVSNPPQDNANSFYGIGSGYDLKTANSAALQDIINKLGVTVSSIYQQRIQVANQNLQTYIDDKIELATEQTSITQYQVLKNNVINNTVYSLIKVEKIDLLNVTEERLATKNILANRQLKSQLNSNNIVWHAQTQQLLQTHGASAYRLATIINLLDANKDIKTNLISWQQLSEKMAKSQISLCVQLVDESHNSSDFLHVIKESLSKEPLKITTQCENKIWLKTTEQQSIVFNKYISLNDVTIELFTNKNQSIANKSVTFSGQSVESYSNARKSALSQFKQILNEQSLWQLLAIIK